MGAYRLVVVGCGHMGGALLRSFLDNSSVVFDEIIVVDSDAAQQNIPAEIGQQSRFSSIANYLESSSAKGTEELPSILLLAVKPQVFSSLHRELLQISRRVPNLLVVSVMAGVGVTSIQKAGFDRVVRVMPNLGTLVNQGMSLIYGPALRNTERKLIEQLFAGSGEVLEVRSEELVDAGTAISGSGPGFLMRCADAWITCATSLGFSREEALLMVQQTFKGTVAWWASSKDEPQKLIQQVKSKGGTTEAGLNSLDSDEITEVFQRCFSAAFRRATELRKTRAE